MTRPVRVLRVVLVAAIALLFAAPPPQLRADDDEARVPIPFADTRIFIEFNATDQDAGVQVFLDGDAWQEVEIVGPNGRKLLEVEGKGSLKTLGLTELFFESEEPSLEDLPLEDFLALFPEGRYRFTGRTVEGQKLVGTATLSHAIPDAPEIVSPAAGEVVDPADAVVISWEAVTGIAGYQVVVEREDPLRVFSVDLPATSTSVTVPPEFLEPDTEYKVEVLAIAASGNKTITESPFQTE